MEDDADTVADTKDGRDASSPEGVHHAVSRHAACSFGVAYVKAS